MIFPRAAFEDFAQRVQIPSRDAGIVPLWPLFGTQTYLLDELEAGLERDVHEFVILKGGRQIGGTTIMDALCLYWLQTFAGMVGMFVADDDPNKEFRRDLHRAMLNSLPPAYRFPTRMENAFQMAWVEPNNSRLIYEAAGKRMGSNLGRSRGVNFGINDEVASWPDQKAIIALKAAYSKRHPQRLYISVSTAKGMGPFKALWNTAETAVAQRAIFVAWWRHEGYRIERTQKALWTRYGAAPFTDEERAMVAAVKKRYRVSLTREQIAWYRWILAEECQGDEAMRAQEYGSLPEECFQAFGDKFISGALVKKLRASLETAPAPKGYRYEWGETFDATAVKPCDPLTAPLLVWEEPDPEGAYVVAGHPGFSSSPLAPNFCAQVWRVWPDRAVQVAEYHEDESALYAFAWVLLHLCATYSTSTRAYLIHEVGYTGQQVLAELMRIERLSRGLSQHAQKSRDVQNLIGNVRHYLWYRIDALHPRMAYQAKTTDPWRAYILGQMRDELERGNLVIRSEKLIDQFAMLRRGEAGEADKVTGGGGAASERATVASYAVECWLKTALPELRPVMTPAEIPPGTPRRVEEMLVQGFFNRLNGGG